jgi:hypothetical protein
MTHFMSHVKFGNYEMVEICFIILIDVIIIMHGGCKACLMEMLKQIVKKFIILVE